MNNSNGKSVDELLAEHRSHELKYNYYIVALNIAYIGYVADRYDKFDYNPTIYLILVALICFSTSVIIGVINIKSISSFVQSNIVHKEIISGAILSDIVSNVDLKKAALKEAAKILEARTNNKGKRMLRRQIFIYLFSILGILSYLLWISFSVLNIKDFSFIVT